MYDYMTPWRPVYENQLDPFNPQHWANESLAILEENLIFAPNVHRDFDKYVASYGQTIHTRKPAEFVAQMMEKGDSITIQDASAVNIEVKLNQLVDVSFMIYDEERTFSFKDLVELYMRPAMLANARMLDRKLAAQSVHFLDHAVGGFGMLDKNTTQDYLVDLERQLNEQKAPETGRNLFLTSAGKAAMLKTDLFTSVERAGTSDAQRRASLGEKFGFNIWTSLNAPSVSGATTETATALDSAAVAGSKSLSLVAEPGIGEYITVAGDMNALRVTAVTGVSTPYTVTVNRAIRHDCAKDAVVTRYKQGTVDNATGYAAGHTKKIHVDGGPVPQIGQIVSFVDGSSSSGTVRNGEYVIVDVTNTGGSDYDIVLDRPLETALADNDAIGYGPNGHINPAFNRNAITLVNRPMALPKSGSGVSFAVAQNRHMAMRVLMSYDQEYKATKVSIDSLFGIKVIEPELGAVLLG